MYYKIKLHSYTFKTPVEFIVKAGGFTPDTARLILLG